MYAVILTGGKQYRIQEGDVLAVEKLPAVAGQTIGFDRVLLLEDGDQVSIGTPTLENALVRAEVLENFKDDKVLVFKKKRRKQYRRTRGHRQQLTRVRVNGIFADGREVAKEIAAAPAPAPAPRRAEAKPAAAPAKPAARKGAPAPAKGKDGGKAKAAAKPAAKPRKPAKEK